MEEIFPNNQAVYAVHTNTENLHIHFILNTVGLNGAKIHMDKSFMSKVFEPALNRFAEKYGFTPNEAWVKGKEENKVSFGEIMAKLRQAVDEAIERSESFDDFLKDLRGQGLSVNCGKYLSLKADGMTKAVRSYRLGSMYTVEMIRDRILKKREELIRSEVGEHTARTKEAASVFVKTSPLKKYRDMTDDEVMNYARVIREKVIEKHIDNKDSDKGIVTVSQGIRNSIPRKANKLWDYMYAADNALYEVKRNSKGEVVLLHKAVISQKSLDDATHI